MLYKNVVTKETLQLLNNLMQDKFLSSFNLVGGTALSLYLGHRISVDLDLFSQDNFDSRKILKYLSDKYDFKENFIERDTLKGTIQNVFVDLITYDYPLIKPVFKEDGIRLLSIDDIVAMKLSAIIDSGTRLKDFADIAFLSTQLSLYDMLKAYTSKFNNSNEVSILKALIYYEDIQKNDMIQLTEGKFNWKFIDKRLHDMENNPTHIFYNNPPIKK